MVIKNTQRKKKVNLNVQSTSTKKIRPDNVSGDSNEEELSISVSYKSKRSAMPEGPIDQGATSIVVSLSILFKLTNMIVKKGVIV